MGETQTWPALRNLPPAAVLAAASMSASSKTSTGACPPSSIVQRLRVAAACLASSLPTSVEPVKLILRGMSEASTRSETGAGSPKTTLSTPSGRPASWKARATWTAVEGVSSEGLMTIEQPAPSAPATLRITFTPGKFHATKAQVGPTGSLRAISRVPGIRQGISRP